MVQQIAVVSIRIWVLIIQICHAMGPRPYSILLWKLLVFPFLPYLPKVDSEFMHQRGKIIQNVNKQYKNNKLKNQLHHQLKHNFCSLLYQYTSTINPLPSKITPSPSCPKLPLKCRTCGQQLIQKIKAKYINNWIRRKKEKGKHSYLDKGVYGDVDLI